jgi:purine-nucleoside phosphorylase
MEEYITIRQIDEAVEAIQQHISITPQVGIILGSGLGAVAELVNNAVVIPFENIPHWPVSTIGGHSGKLVLGYLCDIPVLVMQGRVHYYEGYSMSQVTMPIRVMQRMAIHNLFITNAAGAINPDYQPGNIMLIQDHIGLISMGGTNPLRGPNMDEFGVCFPDMSQPYNHGLMDLAQQVAIEKNITLYKGVYAGLAGPSFETPADLRFLRIIGADAVGMSTVPEVIVANHGKMAVLGLSGVSNKANLDGSTITTHEEVLAAGSRIVPKLQEMIIGILQKNTWQP